MSMKLYPVELSQIQPNLWQNKTTFNVTYTNAEQATVTLMPGEWFVVELMQRYGCFSYLYNDIYNSNLPDDERIPDSNYSYFKRIWDGFVSTNKDNWVKFYEAMTKDYDPTNEFESEEKVDYKNEREYDYGTGLTHSTTYDKFGSTTTHTRATTNQVTTFDNTNDFKNLSHTYDNPRSGESSSDSTEYNGTQSVATTGKYTVTDERNSAKDENKKVVKGHNKSPQELVEKELELRIREEIDDMILNEFAKRYLFLEV